MTGSTYARSIKYTTKIYRAGKPAYLAGKYESGLR